MQSHVASASLQKLQPKLRCRLCTAGEAEDEVAELHGAGVEDEVAEPR